MAHTRAMPVLNADWRSEMTAAVVVVVVVTQLVPLGHYTDALRTWFHTRAECCKELLTAEDTQKNRGDRREILNRAWLPDSRVRTVVRGRSAPAGRELRKVKGACPVALLNLQKSIQTPP